MVRISALLLGSLVGSTLAAVTPTEDASKVTLNRRFLPGTGASLLGRLPSLFHPFGGLLSGIGACQNSLVSGVSMQVAMTQLTQVTTLFQSAFNPLLSCGACGLGGASIGVFGRVLQQCMHGIQGLFSQAQTLFSGQWTSLLSNAFGAFGGIFPSMFNFCNHIGLPFNNLLGGGLIQSFSTLHVESINNCFSRFGLI